MRKNIYLFFIYSSLTILACRGLCQSTDASLSSSLSQIQLKQDDRILILAPHPDDEVLGCAGIIQQSVAMKLPIKVVFLTYGDNNQWAFLVYCKHPIMLPRAVKNIGLVRHDESIEADKTLGLYPENLIFLGYPDFRTLEIWFSHWGKNSAAKSMLTEVTAVPYAHAFRPGAPYKGEEILQDLKTILRQFRPTKIFLSHPADHNPDHQALYLFTRVALWDLRNEVKPAIYPYLIHYKHWPLPRGYHPDKKIISPEVFKHTIPWQEYNLKSEEIESKLVAIKKHKSQYNSCAEYLLSFIRSNELFGDFSVIALTSNTPVTTLTTGRREELREPPEELTEDEQASFIGIEERSVKIEDNKLVFYIKLSRPIGKKVGLSLYVFGYRNDRPFQDMPKLRIRFGRIRHSIYDQKRKMPFNLIKVTRSPREITLRLSLNLLGNPHWILTSARTSSLYAYLGELPLDWVSWQILEVR